jgi:ABC-2 type transport system permease protein
MPIFDQGYQHWQGSLGGHGWRWLAVTRHGVRVGMQNRALRMVVIASWLPSLLLAGVLCLWGMVEQKSSWAMSVLGGIFPVEEFLANPAAFRVPMWTMSFWYFVQTEIWFVMVVMLMVGPGLISQDLRYNALPLYFSRPVTRMDYFLGKLGVVGVFLGMVTVAPAVIAWVLGVLVSLDFTVVFDTGRVLLGIIGYGLVATLSAGLLVLAMSSLSRNSRYVGAFCAGFWFVSMAVFGALEGAHMSSIMIRHSQSQVRAARNVNDPRQLQQEREAQRRFKQELRNELDNDWRPCVSYMSNLQRMADAFLGYYAARDQLRELYGKRQRAMAPQGVGGPAWEEDVDVSSADFEIRWPWHWSAIVLLALGGLSAWILNKRVKDLDRLR